MEHLDPFSRLRVVARAYGVDHSDHATFVELIVESRRVADQFVRRRLAAGEPAFIEAWEPFGGEQALSDIYAWFLDNRDAMLAALS
jgi:hypothetical protein